MAEAAPEPEVVQPSTPASNVNSILALQIAVAITAALYFAREVLIPIALAILLSFVLSPLIDVLRRIRLGRIPSVLISVIVAIGIMLAIAGVIGTQVAQLAGNIPQYSATVEKKIDSLQSYVAGHFSQIATRIGFGAQSTKPGTEEAQPQSGNTAGGATQAHPQEKPSTSPLSLAQQYLFPILSPIATMGIVLVVTIFLLLQQEDLRDRLIRLFGSSDLHRTTLVMDDAARRLSRYLLTQLAINTVFGIVIGIGVFVIGVPNPLLWGLLSGILRFVPYIGSFLSAALPLLLAAAVDPGWSMVLWTAALYIVAELTVSQAVEPVLYGHSTGLSPFAVVVSAIFWSWLWGAIGLILSMPLTLCLVVLGRHSDRLKFLDVLLGDRPPLTPVESFYQRILAGDADEAQDHAETLLEEVSLASYYDEVALKGMQLAARDAERGVLTRVQLERIKTTILALVEELADHEDRLPERTESQEEDVAGAPTDERLLPEDSSVPSQIDKHALDPAWQTEAPALCLAGRGPLDEAASSMLVQLLQRHGIGATMAPYRAASREAIAHLSMEGVQMVCISYLDISGSPSHLRYLLRRVRQKLPNGKIVVGLWPMEDPVLRDPQIRAAVGADYYTTSMREAVNLCLAAARGSPKPQQTSISKSLQKQDAIAAAT